jgi:hypothetical protein
MPTFTKQRAMRYSLITKLLFFIIGYFVASTINYFQDNVFVYRDRFGTITQNLGERVTTSSLSPNDKVRVLLVEPQNFIDRNFEIRIQSEESRDSVTIFRSPDEGKPAGSERIIWNHNGSRFALLGRHFINKNISESFKTKKGETFYLVYDLSLKKLYYHFPDILVGYTCSQISIENMKEFGF